MVCTECSRRRSGAGCTMLFSGFSSYAPYAGAWGSSGRVALLFFLSPFCDGLSGRGVGIMVPVRQGRGRWDGGGVLGQRVSAECPDGLPPSAGDGAPLRGPGSAMALPPGGGLRRRLRGGGLSAGAGMDGCLARKAGGGVLTGSHRLRRTAEISSAGAPLFRPLLRHGGLRAGAGAPLRGDAGGEGHLLHPCGSPGAAHCRHFGLPAAEHRLPGGGQAGDGGKASGAARPPGWPGDRRCRPL